MKRPVEFEVSCHAGLWLLEQDGAVLAGFNGQAAAVRRGRWLAARAAVRGLESQLNVRDCVGRLSGVWRDEAFEPARVDLLLVA